MKCNEREYKSDVADKGTKKTRKHLLSEEFHIKNGFQSDEPKNSSTRTGTISQNTSIFKNKVLAYEIWHKAKNQSAAMEGF